jgi:hypothetical protein
VVLAVHAARVVRHQKSYVGLPAAGFAVAYLGATLVEALLPLQRVAVLPYARGNPMRRMRTAVAAFEWGSIWRIPLTDVVLFFPLGALAVMALVELGWSHWRAARSVAARGDRRARRRHRARSRGLRALAPGVLAPGARPGPARRAARGVCRTRGVLGVAAVRPRDGR